VGDRNRLIAGDAAMADVRKEEKQSKKDQLGPREVIEETKEEIRDGGTTRPPVQQPNRDRARGDWDRTGDHHDEGTSRAEE
jgi:hypothetical protein